VPNQNLSRASEINASPGRTGVSFITRAAPRTQFFDMAQTFSADLWQPVYEAAIEFRNAQPWKYIDESTLLGIQNPDTSEICWCSIMGRAAEYCSLVVYRGAQGLNSYFDMMDAATQAESAFNPETLNAMFLQDCWTIAFLDASMVSKEQKAHLKKLGLAFKGPGQWITVEVMEPGLDPWLPEIGDLPFLVHCLREMQSVAERSMKNPDLLQPDRILVRTPVQKDGLHWEDRFIKANDLPEPPEPPAWQPSKKMLEKMKFMKSFEGAVVIASFLSPAPIRENKTARPWRPMLLLGIDPGSGMILSQQMAPLPEVVNELEQFLLDTFKVIGGKPLQIGVHSHLMAGWLSAFCYAQEIELIYQSGNEPYYTDALHSLSGMKR